MQIKINLKNIKTDEIELIVNFLMRKKIIVYPTDTIYGLGCVATGAKAIKKINKIKQQDSSKSMLVLVSSINMVKRYCYVNRRQAEFLKKNWPGRVTVILPSRHNLPKQLFGKAGKEGGLAVRLPNNKFLIKIINRVHAPIVSTSANIHGQKNVTNVHDIEKIFKKTRPDLVIDAGTLDKKPSRIVDIRNMENIKVIR